MRYPALLLIALLAAIPPASAATLYRWTDASGTMRYGHQPPPGSDAQPTAQTEGAAPSACHDLAEQHLALIDREIQRVAAAKTGLGPEFDYTPTAQQSLLLDLYAHRAALVTGRPATEFRAPSLEDAERAKARLQAENLKMRGALSAQEADLDATARQLSRARHDASFARRMNPLLWPGYALGPWPWRGVRP